MISPSAQKRLGWVVCTLAVVAGCGAAVAASGASEERRAGSITIRGDNVQALTIQGSNFGDEAIVVQEGAGEPLTISGATISSERPGCEPSGSGDGSYVCASRDLATIEASLGAGRDRLSFAGDGMRVLTIRGATGDGNDFAAGGSGTDLLKGGQGRDSVYGGKGDDKLDGGPDADELDGGRGEDVCDRDPKDTSRVKCETTHLRD